MSDKTEKFYFEVDILSSAIGKLAAIGIGLATKYDLQTKEAMIGWTSGDWGYHGDDGKKFCSRSEIDYAPMYLHQEFASFSISPFRDILQVVE